MIFLLTFILAMLILGTSFGVFNIKNYTSEVETRYGTETKVNTILVTKLVVAVLVSFIIGMVNPITVERIDVGNVGLKVNNTGDERGVSKTAYVTGWVFYNNWLSRIKEFPVTQQHIDYEETCHHYKRWIPSNNQTKF
jgi:hypothetical protein